MNEITVFTNKELGGIRVLEKDGQVWFVGKDVAGILGYKNATRDVNRHVDDEDKGSTVLVTPGGDQELTIINESGLYSLILSSKLPKARQFKRWVTSEVLPSIRKTGGYARGNETEFLIRSVTAAVMEQIPAIVTETVKQTLNAILNDAVADDIKNPDLKFRLLDIKEPPSELLTDPNLEEAEFWESLLLEWRRFRTFIKYKAEADKAFIALCHDKYPDLRITLRTLYRKWNAYEKTGRQALIDRRGKHGNHRRRVIVTVEIDGGPGAGTEN